MAASPKSKKSTSNIGQGNSAQQFLIWHGEKIVVAIVAAAALWLAVQGLGYQSLDWQPSELEQEAGTAEQTIRESTQAAADQELKIFDYAAYAEQIKEPIPLDPYRNESQWKPALFTPPASGGSVQ